jgi:pimeloyl-ACP methyl ester carboxylesterase
MHIVQLAEGPIHYRDSGAGNPVVFVHGLLVSGTLWQAVMDRMPQGIRCIAPDWPLGSHTAPMREAADLTPFGIATIVAAFLDALDLRDVTLVGNDSGGAVCQLVMVHYPNRIGRVVLTTCDAFDVFPPKQFAYLSVLAAMPFLLMPIAKLVASVRSLRRLRPTYGLLTRTWIEERLLDQWTAPCARDPKIRRDLAKLLAGISPKVTQGVASHFAKVQVPVLVAWTPEDPSFPTRLARELVAALPHATYATIDESYVFSALDNPARVAELISTFHLLNEELLAVS